MAYGESNGHVTDDVKWPWYVKLVTPVRLKLDLETPFQSTTSRKWPTYGGQNGHVIDDVTWPSKVKLVTPTRLERNISKTAGDAI